MSSPKAKYKSTTEHTENTEKRRENLEIARGRTRNPEAFSRLFPPTTLAGAFRRVSVLGSRFS
jgi:hypothetical protein